MYIWNKLGHTPAAAHTHPEVSPTGYGALIPVDGYCDTGLVHVKSKT